MSRYPPASFCRRNSITRVVGSRVPTRINPPPEHQNLTARPLFTLSPDRTPTQRYPSKPTDEDALQQIIADFVARLAPF